MVCKEDVLLWFKDLDSYKRIDVMHELLNMCIPFEVRFLGTCLEELGKHTFQELRGPTILANDMERLAKDTTLQLGLTNDNTRHRAVIYMSVLNCRNCTCANWYYATLINTERTENFVNAESKDNETISELLLFFTLTVYHPAFNFDQKNYIAELIENLVLQRGHNEKLLAIDGPLAPHNFPTLMESMKSPPVKEPPPDLLGNQRILPIQYHTSKMTRTGFPIITIGAPEAHPFPPHPVSPIVSQPTSPPQSRATSPPRGYGMRPLAMGPTTGPLQPPVVNLSDSSSSLDQTLTQSSGSSFNSPPHDSSIRNPEVDMCQAMEEKPREAQWMSPPGFDPNLRHPNGMRYPKVTYIAEQMQSLKMEGENSMHCSSSASSSSSVNQSPTETPSATPVVTPHGPGRGMEVQTRANGIPFMCDLNAPPPAPFSNVPSYSLQHPHPVNSMMAAPRPPNCYNCGGLGHTGTDCNAQTIDDITQKPFALDYDSSNTPDRPPDH